MDRPVRLDTAGMHEVDPERLSSEELYYAAAHAPRAGHAYRLAASPVEGVTAVLELLHFPDSHRAGIAWRADVWWLDAAAADEALRRWMEGEGRASVRRPLSRAEEWAPAEVSPPAAGA